MKNLEKIPYFEKIENYINYRSFDYSKSRELKFDLQLVYFQRFVIIRDLLSSDCSKIKNKDFFATIYQSKPIIVHRELFDLVHPIDNIVEKGKRFLRYCIYYDGFNEEGCQYEDGDLIKRKKDIPLLNFLNFLASCGFKNVPNSRQELSNLLDFIFSKNPETYKNNDFQEQKLFNAIFYTNQDYSTFDKEYSYEISHYHNYLDVIEYHELYLTFIKFVISVDYILKINQEDFDVNRNLSLILTPQEMEEEIERDNMNEEPQNDDNFGYYANLVQEGLLNPNDPNYPY